MARLNYLQGGLINVSEALQLPVYYGATFQDIIKQANKHLFNSGSNKPISQVDLPSSGTPRTNEIKSRYDQKISEEFNLEGITFIGVELGRRKRTNVTITSSNRDEQVIETIDDSAYLTGYPTTSSDLAAVYKSFANASAGYLSVRLVTYYADEFYPAVDKNVGIFESFRNDGGLL